MRRIEDLTGNTLNWVQPRPMSRQFELRQDGDVLANLRFETSLGSLARAETADAAYTFKRIGYFRPGVTIRLVGSTQDLGSFQPDWGTGGLIALASGAKYTFHCANFRGARWSMLDETGECVLEFVLKSFVKTGAQVTFGRSCEDAPLLALFGGYLMVLMADDAATTQKASIAAVSQPRSVKPTVRCRLQPTRYRHLKLQVQRKPQFTELALFHLESPCHFLWRMLPQFQ